MKKSTITLGTPGLTNINRKTFVVQSNHEKSTSELNARTILGHTITQAQNLDKVQWDLDDQNELIYEILQAQVVYNSTYASYLSLIYTNNQLTWNMNKHLLKNSTSSSRGQIALSRALAWATATLNRGLQKEIAAKELAQLMSIIEKGVGLYETDAESQFEDMANLLNISTGEFISTKLRVKDELTN